MVHLRGEMDVLGDAIVFSPSTHHDNYIPMDNQKNFPIFMFICVF